MATANLSIFILILTTVAQATWVRGVEIPVLDQADNNWREGVDYEAWADGKEMNPGDLLVFTFPPGKHSVATMKDVSGYDTCSFESKTWESGCGRVGTWVGSEPAWYTSTIGEDCKKGMKFKVTPKPSPKGLEGKQTLRTKYYQG